LGGGNEKRCSVSRTCFALPSNAAYHPDKSWQLLGQAERWEHLAEEELAFHFKECNADRSVYSTNAVETQNADGLRWETIAAA
jgi:hypothetical protein